MLRNRLPTAPLVWLGRHLTVNLARSLAAAIQQVAGYRSLGNTRGRPFPGALGFSGQRDRRHARPDLITPSSQHPHLPLTAFLSMRGRAASDVRSCSAPALAGKEVVFLT